MPDRRLLLLLLLPAYLAPGMYVHTSYGGEGAGAQTCMYGMMYVWYIYPGYFTDRCIVHMHVVVIVVVGQVTPSRRKTTAGAVNGHGVSLTAHCSDGPPPPSPPNVSSSVVRLANRIDALQDPSGDESVTTELPCQIDFESGLLSR